MLSNGETFIPLLLWLIIGAGFGFWASRVAANKGHNKTLWFFLGIFGCMIAVILAYIIPAKTDGNGHTS